MSQEETTQAKDAENLEIEEHDIPASADEAPPTTQAKADDSALAEAQQQAAEYLNNWQRERADFANYKKRAERELRESEERARISAYTSLLPVIDDFELAMSNLPQDLNGQPWLEGISAIQRKFRKILDEQGITAIDPVGEVFDPSHHEALGVDSNTEIESGHITITLQKGYRCGDKILRPALVRVAE